ncbi:hypothetical protein COT69_02975 [candidate division WWE3 bacterium CG09_land_8_20_14_0_10_39_24]|uniref:Uncharacterized protein n=2 Tax=Katanobacteria TaxID=422282 RepID=A0A2G9XBV0_UNCKA|nr:MAG: hypothetical protein AUJ94_00470 [bacterium CG2_30_40_12]OJI08336.1 MAG: hypothetical protein BK003_02820 [bacterium CG09_39_24]PIP04444.1 MAG: hypothetical protein COX53_02560 [candidate division WWE3 bacterium CG23_combo_of_CG06-09_8_20_14_all_40_14]PIS12644.1 MAG: hypothetical protein COT69_02975 [candidate division WWE3 bacterium CG09_land_8_20_14_0_10_39_24]
MINLTKLSFADKKSISALFMALSIICTVFAGIGSFYTDVVLASTQWILLAVLFAVWGLYLKLELKT